MLILCIEKYNIIAILYEKTKVKTNTVILPFSKLEQKSHCLHIVIFNNPNLLVVKLTETADTSLASIAPIECFITINAHLTFYPHTSGKVTAVLFPSTAGLHFIKVSLWYDHS